MIEHSQLTSANRAISLYEEIRDALTIGMGRSPKQHIPPTNQTDEEFAKKALLKYLTIYSVTTGKGPLKPEEGDIKLVGTQGVGQDVILFRYPSTGNLKMMLGIVPSKETNSAEVQIKRRHITESPVTHKWVPIMNVN